MFSDMFVVDVHSAEARPFLVDENQIVYLSYYNWLSSADLLLWVDDPEVKKFFLMGLCPAWARHEVHFRDAPIFQPVASQPPAPLF